MMKLSLIAALADNRVIGLDNKMPWHLPNDLKHFKAVTLNKPVIMGRKTWESLGRALPNRLNIVVTRQASFSAEGAEVCVSLESAIDHAKHWAEKQGINEVMLIGGAQLYKQALQASIVDRMYLTRIHITPNGDAWFPEFDTEKWCKMQSDEFLAEDNKPAYTIECWDKLINCIDSDSN